VLIEKSGRILDQRLTDSREKQASMFQNETKSQKTLLTHVFKRLKHKVSFMNVSE